ncbi:MAG: hypothetical protein KY464_10250, partial [Gemmatimonadetes bacterium]|nr:hypothetical protein [Gemmatimonadota bacterium]
FQCRAVQMGEQAAFVKHLDAWSATEDIELRRRLEEEYLDAVDEEEPVFQDHLARRRGVYEELGYGSAIESLEVVCEVDVRGLARDAARFVEDTEAEYCDLLAWHLPRLAGVEVGQATAFDLRALRPGPALRREFAARAPIPTFTALLQSSPLDLSADGRLVIERHPELASGARARYCPLKVPGTVILMETRATDAGTHAAALRALGQALHSAHTAPDLPVEFRRFGDPSVRLASGLLFESLLHQPPFLRHAYHLRPDLVAEWRRYAVLLLLVRLRRLAALLQVEIEWAEGAPAEEVRGRGSELLTRAAGVQHDRRGTFALLELPIQSARALRGELLAAVLALSMRERFDEDWYRNPDGCEELRGIFADGLRYTADERSVQLSSAPLGFQPVTEWVTELLR